MAYEDEKAANRAAGEHNQQQTAPLQPPYDNEPRPHQLLRKHKQPHGLSYELHRRPRSRGDLENQQNLRLEQEEEDVVVVLVAANA